MRAATNTAWMRCGCQYDEHEYKVIVVGDAAMAPSELLSPGGASYPRHEYNKETGLQWIQRIRKRYPHMVWLRKSDFRSASGRMLTEAQPWAGPQGSSDV